MSYSKAEMSALSLWGKPVAVNSPTPNHNGPVKTICLVDAPDSFIVEIMHERNTSSSVAGALNDTKLVSCTVRGARGNDEALTMLKFRRPCQDVNFSTTSLLKSRPLWKGSVDSRSIIYRGPI